MLRLSIVLNNLNMKLQELDIIGFIQVILYALLGKNITVLGS